MSNLQNSPMLIQAGLQPKLRWNNEPEPGKFYLPEWNPVPTLEFFDHDPATAFAKIGSQQYYLRTEADIENFINKAVPTFCDKQPKK